jgi:trk system potassium uptake protein
VKLIVIGCGRVGSTIAKRFASEGWDVTAVDENESALSRLGENWTGGFIVGHGAAGIEDADAVVVSTDGDNTNLIIGQVAQKRFGIDCTVVRILDPARADFYRERGLRTICPTSTAIDGLTEAVRSCDIPQREKATV